MTSPSVQFVEMVREAYAKLAKKQAEPVEGDYNFKLYKIMFCEQCGKERVHALDEIGDWEIYTCKCGCQKRYRVR